MPTDIPDTSATPGDDLLEGDGKISHFTLGSSSPRAKRRARALMLEVEPVEARLPSFLMGGKRCSRKSWILQWLDECRAREEARAHAAAEAKAAAKAADEARHFRRTRGRPASRGSAPASRHPVHAATIDE